MAHLRIDLLGGLRVRFGDGRPAAIPGRKAQAILAHLARHAGRAQSRDRLAALLWEDRGEAQARASLRQALSQLRQALRGHGRALVAGEGGQLLLDPGEAECDVHGFEALLADGSPAALERAMVLWQGDFLEGFDAHAPAFEDWLLVERQNLRLQAVRALDRLLVAEREADRPEGAIAAAQRLLALDPLREDVHRTLMQLLASCGRHAAALNQYRRCRAALERELGLPPDPQTEALRRDIVRRRRAAGPGLPPSVGVVEVEAAHVAGCIGREPELSLLRGLIDTCLLSGRGQAVLVRGEAGMGKTRLIEEAAHSASRLGLAVHWGQVLDFGSGSGGDAVRALARGLLGLSGDAPPGLRRAVATGGWPAQAVGPAGLASLYDLLDLPQPPEQRAAYDAMDEPGRVRGRHRAMAALLRAAGARQPRLLVIEDLHWAGPPMLADLASLAEAVRDAAALLVLTARPEAQAAESAAWAAIAQAVATGIDLRPLSEAESLDLATRFGGLDADCRRVCVHRAAGNPLFLEQLLLDAQRGGTGVPATVQATVLARLDRLAPGLRRIVEAASVLGQRFAVATLSHLLEAPAGDGCAELARTRLMRPDEAGWRFAHVLIQEAVYEALPAALRRDLHRRAAAWFAGRDPTLRAEHLERAGVPEAGEAFLEAATAAAALHRLEPALTLAERGLAGAPPASSRFALADLRVELLRELGRTADSVAAARAALALASGEREQGRAWAGIAAGLRVLDRYDEALEALARAEESARRDGTADDLMRIHSLRGNVLFPLGDLDGCLREHRAAVELACRAGSADGEAQALGGLGDAYYQRGAMRTARVHFDRCLDLCTAYGFGRIEVAHRHMRGLTRFYANDLDGALDDGRSGVRLASMVGAARAEMVGRNTLSGFVLPAIGAWDEALAEAQTTLMLARRLGARRFEAATLGQIGQALRALGRRREAVRAVEQAWAVCRETGTRFCGPWILSVMALALDDPDRARRMLAEGEELLDGEALSHNHLQFRPNAIEVALAAGDWSEALRHADALERYVRPEPLPWASFMAARARALAAAAQHPGEPAVLASLRELRRVAETAGLRDAQGALDRALAVGAPGHVAS